MKIRSSPVIPSLVHPGTPLDGVRAGVIVGIIDSDASVYVNYLVQAPDGTQYCAQMDTRRRRNRHALLCMALESGRSMMVAGGINSYVRTAVIGDSGQSLRGNGSNHANEI